MNFIKDFFSEMISMIKPYYKYIRFLFMILLFFLSSYIFQSILIAILNINVEMLSITSQTLLVLVANCMTLIVMALLYFKEIKKDFIKLKKYKKDKLFNIYDNSFRYWLIGVIIMFVSTFIIEKLGVGDATNDTKVVNNLSSSPIIYGVIVLIVKPIIEELTFRLAFKDIFKNKWLFVLLSGIIFGSIHVIFSLSDIYQLLYLIPYCSLGIALSYMHYESDNIYVPISFHILHNSLTAITTFLLAGVWIW